MDFGELMNTYDVHAKYLPRHKEQRKTELKLENTMRKISDVKDEQQRLLNNAKTYLKNRREYTNNMTNKDIFFQADMRYRLRKLNNQQDVHDINYMIGTMPSAPTTKLRGGKRTLKRRQTRKSKCKYRVKYTKRNKKSSR